MAYQSYSAYHSQPHSEALRPTVSTSFAQHAAYEPIETHGAVSPDLSPDHMDRPFAQPHADSSESIGSGPHYGAGTGGRDDNPFRDDIPLRSQPQNQYYETQSDSTHGNKGPQPFVGEAEAGAGAGAGAEEAGRPVQRQRSRREPKKVGIFHKVAWVCWFMTLVQLAVFIAELVKASVLTGSPIETKPQFNPMIGPSPHVLMVMGARYVPCMKDVSYLNVTASVLWQCPNSTSNDYTDPNNHCTLGEVCGLNASPGDYPVFQWFRFITPIFLHAGIVHIGFNLLLQMTLGREIEHLIGSVRFFFVYMASGIFGFVLGGNYAGPFIPSVGCSGSLFGITAISLLDLLYTWKRRKNPKVELGLIFLEIVVSFALGLLPGLDNFSHIGGFLTGLVLGMCLLRSPDTLRKRIRPRSTVSISGLSPTEAEEKQRAQVANFGEFTKKPLGFFQGRKPFWWAWWLVRAGCLVAVFAAFIVLLNNFYLYGTTCTWCRYLSCLPVNNWCDIGRTGVQNVSTSARRDLFESSLISGY